MLYLNRANEACQEMEANCEELQHVSIDEQIINRLFSMMKPKGCHKDKR